jgi:hypothetical protein
VNYDEVNTEAVQKRRRRMTEKERAFLREIAKGKTQTAAAMKAYDAKDEKSAAAIGSKTMTRISETWPELMDRYFGDDKIAKVIGDAFRAKKSWYSKAKGDMVTEKDHMARLKAADMALKLKNKYPKEEVDHNHQFVVTLGDGTDDPEHTPIIIEKEESTGLNDE